MRNFTGYFLEVLVPPAFDSSGAELLVSHCTPKFGGLTRKPWTLSPWEPVNQKGSSGDIATSERTASFKWVIRATPLHSSSRRASTGRLSLHESLTGMVR